MSTPKVYLELEKRVLDTGDSMTGPLTLSGAPTANLHAATKQYVDDNTPDVANAAVKLETARDFAIADNDGSNIGPTASFNGTANTIINLPATIKASLNGNASTTTKLATARTISLTGDVTGSGSFDGSGDLSITATVADSSHSHNNYLPIANATTSTQFKVIGGTTNGNSLYMWNDATYRNPDNHTPELIIQSNNSTTGVKGFRPGLVLYNNIGSINATVGMTFAFREEASAGNAVMIGSIVGYKEVAGTNNAWSAGGLRFLTNNTGVLVEALTLDKSGNAVVKGTITGSSVYGAVWNDYAEFRKSEELQPGRVVCENGDGTLSRSIERMQAAPQIVSDTFGFAIGETDECKTPLAVSGRVLAYPYEPRESYKAGDAVCAGPDGTVSKMSREEIKEYPDRIVGIVSEIPDYERWGTGNVEVNGRIWIKVK